MGQGKLNLIKLCVGVESPAELVAWQTKRRRETGIDHAQHVTRMWPKRSEELLDGGSIYWVMKGFIKARQEIIGLEKRVGDDGITRCAILLNPNVVNIELTPRRAFQGWRYLADEQVPRDIRETENAGTSLPADLEFELARLGVR